MPPLPERDDIADRYKWDLTAIFDSEQRWQTEYDAVTDRVSEFETYSKSDVTTTAELASVLERSDELSRRTGRLFIYARLRHDEDTTDTDNQTRFGRAQALLGRFREATGFVEPAIIDLGEELVIGADELAEYQQYLADVLRRDAHIPGPPVRSTLETLEPVLDAPDGTFTTFVNRDYRAPTVDTPSGESVTITPNTYADFLRHPDRDFRRSVYTNYHDAIAAARHVLVDSFSTMADRNVCLAQVRVTSPLERPRSTKRAGVTRIKPSPFRFTRHSSRRPGTTLDRITAITS